MDMSATDFQRALNHESAMPPFGKSVLIAALSLFLAGCGALQKFTVASTSPPTVAGANSVRELASAAKPPEKPSRPALPAVQSSQRAIETKPPSEAPPAIAKKGVEKLSAPKASAPVAISERTTTAAKPAVPKTPITADTGAGPAAVAATGPVVKELIFKGGPRHDPPRRAGLKVFVWVLAGLGCAALAGLAWFHAKRRARLPGVPAGRKDDEIKTPGLLFKDPLPNRFPDLPGPILKEPSKRAQETLGAGTSGNDFLLRFSPEEDEPPEEPNVGRFQIVLQRIRHIFDPP